MCPAKAEVVSVKIAVIFDSLHPEWEDAAFKREVEQKAEEAEYDVARALLAGGHDVLLIGIGDDVAPLLAKLADFQPKQIGRASWRGRGEISVGAGSFKKKKKK